MSQREQNNRDRTGQNRDYRDRNERDQNDDWAEQVPWTRNQGPYRDFGWERGESALPEFRDDSVHVQPYERQRVNRWRQVNWNKEYNYGTEMPQGPYSGVGPKGYQRSDERIFEDVCDRLTQHGQIDARNMQVNVKDGEVTLTGTVDNRQTKRMAERVAEQVKGVHDVHNQLRVSQSGQNYQSGQNRQGGSQSGNQSGMPGGGKGRVDQVGGSGVYPASGPLPQENAPVQGEASWGQGDRGAAGYQDSGTSELNIPPENKGKKQS